MKTTRKTFLLTTASLLLSAIFMSCDKSNKEQDEPDIPSGIIPEADGEIVTEGHVDLGLSVEWAACNLEAESCYDSGTIFMMVLKEGTPEDICGTDYDQASELLGENWRLPTKAQVEELSTKCRLHNTKYRGVDGLVITGPTKKAIFLPDEDYWIGTLDINTNELYYFKRNWTNINILTKRPISGCKIRPVYSDEW